MARNFLKHIRPQPKQREPRLFCAAMVVNLDNGDVALRPLVGTISIAQTLKALMDLHNELVRQSTVNSQESTQEKKNETK